ncbi:MAG: translation elongation factor 4 [Candidatus Gracilibacteria bacterium]|nr:translation elongation factor 4 [Candidatus Gracilibacteria bacterium]MDD2908676.1 translation elongation factor 4 [Candidatus Gracilibacteria bacterium]
MNIRNFCIIAHIDHGKSTLADRMLEITGTIAKRDMKHAQTLDSMDIEQERGITIKLTPVRMNWKGVQLNLIDTPGHVDFQYEVSRSLASVEGAILVVDATQGIEAQTLSNVYLALENDLEIIPVLNKIDLPSADPERVGNEIISLLGCKREDIIKVSAKTGENVESVLDAVIAKFPLPKKLDKDSNFIDSKKREIILTDSVSSTEGHKVTKALIFDSQYDPYKGVVIYVKLFSGSIKKGDKLEFLNTGAKIEVGEVGYFAPKYNPAECINEGEIGYIISGLKSLSDAKVGDTIFAGNDISFKHPIKGFKQITPFIFAGIYPVDNDEYIKLKDAVEKLQLNDSSLRTENEVSPALGYGFRCGFLGLLHLDIVKERLWREFEMDVIITSPQVTYKVLLAGDKVEEYRRFKSELTTFQDRPATQITISNPEDLPKPGTYIQIDEPIAKLEMITPIEFTGNMMQLAQDRRGIFVNQHYLDSTRVVLVYEIPIAEIVGDFYDDLKSLSSGYASMSYEFLKYKTDDLVKVDILVAGERLEALSMMVHRGRSRTIGANICRKLKDNIPKAQFSIAIQAAIGAQVIAREDISALRKDVTAKLYGGDVSRKRKVLDKQKEGKKKMKQFGRVSIPSETFVNILKKD